MTDDLLERLSDHAEQLDDAKIFVTAELLFEAAAEITRLRAELAAVTDRLRAIIDGDVPRPVAMPWAGLDTPSKHDLCAHGNPMYNDCAACIVEFARLPIPGAARP